MSNIVNSLIDRVVKSVKTGNEKEIRNTIISIAMAACHDSELYSELQEESDTIRNKTDQIKTAKKEQFVRYSSSSLPSVLREGKQRSQFNLSRKKERPISGPPPPKPKSGYITS